MEIADKILQDIETELSSIPGVSSVDIMVNVSIHTIGAEESRDSVYQKELELLDKYPELLLDVHFSSIKENQAFMEKIRNTLEKYGDELKESISVPKEHLT